MTLQAPFSTIKPLGVSAAEAPSDVAEVVPRDGD
jgi:hypothetical protein